MLYLVQPLLPETPEGGDTGAWPHQDTGHRVISRQAEGGGPVKEECGAAAEDCGLVG